MSSSFAVIRSGAFLGIGGKSFAVPYNQLEWTPNTKSYFARMTREQIDRQVEFTPEDWNTLEETTWMDQFQDWADEDDRRSYDDNVTIDRNAKPVEISGRITEVERVNEGTPYEQIRVTLQTREGQTAAGRHARGPRRPPGQRVHRIHRRPQGQRAAPA